MDKKQLRERLLASRKVKSEVAPLDGLDIEWRQPTLRSVLGQDVEDEGTEFTEAEINRRNIARYIIRMAYVPGTNDRIFEDHDIDDILSWPLDSDFIKVQEIISRLTGLDVPDAKEELKADPLAE